MRAIRDNLVQCFTALRTQKHGISYGNGWTHVDGWSGANRRLHRRSGSASSGLTSRLRTEQFNQRTAPFFMW